MHTNVGVNTGILACARGNKGTRVYSDVATGRRGCLGTLVRVCGRMADGMGRRAHGDVGTWTRGCMATRQHGDVVTRTLCCLETWQNVGRGCIGTWEHGDVAAC